MYPIFKESDRNNVSLRNKSQDGILLYMEIIGVFVLAASEPDTIMRMNQ